MSRSSDYAAGRPASPSPRPRSQAACWPQPPTSRSRAAPARRRIPRGSDVDRIRDGEHRTADGPVASIAWRPRGHRDGAGADVHHPRRDRRRLARAPRVWRGARPGRGGGRQQAARDGSRGHGEAGRAGRRVELLDTRIPRDQLLDWLARARVAVLVPNPEEGFYLPAIEAMALGTLMVLPDCLGNRFFCEPGVNCFRPPWEVGAIVAQAEQALTVPTTTGGSSARHGPPSRPRRRASRFPGHPRPARRALGRLMATIVVAGAIANKARNGGELGASQLARRARAPRLPRRLRGRGRTSPASAPIRSCSTFAPNRSTAATSRR